MSQWTIALSSEGHKQLPTPSDAMAVGAADTKTVYPLVTDDTLSLAAQLTLDIPEYSWTIEVDLLGRHRITIHFKGASIALDE